MNKIIEKALLEAEQLEETMRSNAKEILSSTMKEEIEELVKESLSEKDDYLKEQEGPEEEVDIVIDDEADMDFVSDDDEELDVEDETGVSIDLELDELPPLDLTLASDDEVLKVFKAMGDEDGIIIQKDDDEITITDDNTDSEYLIKLDEEKTQKMKKENLKETDEEMDMTEMEDMDNVEMEEDVVYEIELSEDEDEVVGVDAPESEDTQEDLDDDKVVPEEVAEEDFGGKKGDESKSRRDYMEDKTYGGKKGDESKSRRDYTEAARTKGFGRSSNGKHKPSGIRKGISNNRNLGENRMSRNYKLLKEEVASLKTKNNDYKKALTTFRDKLNEVGVFNSNLAYATRLFTENSTTKAEKINILRRFDNVNSLKESKELYRVIKEELSQNVSKKNISESVERKISKSPSSGSNTKLMESKVYENPQFARIKDLISKL